MVSYKKCRAENKLIVRLFACVLIAEFVLAFAVVMLRA
jgi:hypothetical protein